MCIFLFSGEKQKKKSKNDQPIGEVKLLSNRNPLIQQLFLVTQYNQILKSYLVTLGFIVLT